MVRADSHETSLMSCYSGIPWARSDFRLRASHPLWSDFPFASPNPRRCRYRAPTTPEASFGFGLLRFRSPLLTESFHFLFLRLLRCFTSPGIALCVLSHSLFPRGMRTLRTKAIEYDLDQVTPFGNSRVKAYLPLTVTYRSLSRPSSPAGAKASIMCSS